MEISNSGCQPRQRLSSTASNSHKKCIASWLLQDATDPHQVLQHVPTQKLCKIHKTTPGTQVVYFPKSHTWVYRWRNFGNFPPKFVGVLQMLPNITWMKMASKRFVKFTEQEIASFTEDQENTNTKKKTVSDLNMVKWNLTKLTTTSLATKRSTSLAVKRFMSLAGIQRSIS